MTLFGTAGIRGPVETAVTPELALAVGRAAGLDAREHGDTRFVVGRDGRTSGPTLERALVAGLLASGCDVGTIGVAPTPALAYASRGRRGVMLTASHNPPADNGIKLFDDGVEYDLAGEERVAERVETDDKWADWERWSRPRQETVLEEYRDAVATYARGYGADLDGLPVAVDCGNGMASLATPQVLGALGGSVTALAANVDGRFPARESKPTPESLADLRALVADGPYELGFGADGDADRLVVVDAAGEVVHEDTVLAILAETYVDASDVADPVVVTTPNASSRVDERVHAAGGRVERVALGYLHEGIAAAREGGGSVVFAGEPWKHVHPAFGGWMDGVTSAAVLSRLVAAAGGLSELRAPIAERPYRKVNVDCVDGRKPAAMAELEDSLPAEFDEATVDTEYGIRLDRPDGSWVLVRPSGTEPYLRIYAEGEAVDEIVARAVDTVEAAVDAAA